MLVVRVEGPEKDNYKQSLIDWAEGQAEEVRIVWNTHYLGKATDGKWQYADAPPPVPALDETQPIVPEPAPFQPKGKK